jgi:hypothetical protein
MLPHSKDPKVFSDKNLNPYSKFDQFLESDYSVVNLWNKWEENLDFEYKYEKKQEKRQSIRAFSECLETVEPYFDYEDNFFSKKTKGGRTRKRKRNAYV